jgi:cell wall-associated NlpC family hydrolase
MEIQVSDRPTGRLRRLIAGLRRAGTALPAALVLIGLGVVAALLLGGGGGHARPKPPDTDPALTPDAAKRAAHEQKQTGGGHVVQLAGVGSQPKPSGGSAADDAPSPGAPSDAQVRADLREARAALRSFSSHLDTAFLETGPRARVLRDGSAQAPDNAPDIIKRVILAGNEIAKFPYKWGGGHGAWRDNGYDCSGSVSFALAGAGLLDRPLTSGSFMNWGRKGRGKWITIYASPGHVFMFVAGLRFDTSGQGRAGTRWQNGGRPAPGFAVVHPPSL